MTKQNQKSPAKKPTTKVTKASRAPAKASRAASEAQIAVSRKQRAITLFAIVVIAGLAILGLSLYFGTTQMGSASTPAPQKAIVTVSGSLECLPKKDKTGPQTQECVYGIKVNNGYYGLRNAASPESYGDGKGLVVTGTLMTPAEGDTHDVIGYIVVSSVNKSY
ncbi:hypothetical protein JNJ66_07655 [Candidatus Saccharibacteria bacterium]|nr:hypothetical protein [Candidatus Saccharibacteria bacterium]